MAAFGQKRTSNDRQFTAQDRAIELLDEHFATPPGWTIEGLSRDPRLDPIRDHPGWLALLEKYKRP